MRDASEQQTATIKCQLLPGRLLQRKIWFCHILRGGYKNAIKLFLPFQFILMGTHDAVASLTCHLAQEA